MGILERLLPHDLTAAEMLDRLSPVTSPPQAPQVSPPCTVAFKRPDGSLDMNGPLVYRYATGQWEWSDGRSFNRVPTHWMFE